LTILIYQLIIWNGYTFVTETLVNNPDDGELYYIECKTCKKLIRRIGPSTHYDVFMILFEEHLSDNHKNDQDLIQYFNSKK
jgi:hypothetical protein